MQNYKFKMNGSKNQNKENISKDLTVQNLKRSTSKVLSRNKNNTEAAITSYLQDYVRIKINP